jgi:hypothetical protein
MTGQGEHHNATRRNHKASGRLQERANQLRGGGILDPEDFEAFTHVPFPHREGGRKILVSDHKDNRCQITCHYPLSLPVEDTVPPPTCVAGEVVKREGCRDVLLAFSWDCPFKVYFFH